MINKYINISSNIAIYEKLSNIHINNIRSIYFNKLNITLIIPSNSKNYNGFVTMLVLFEKNINNQPVFLLDYKTLSRNRTIKVGLTITIYGEILNNYLHMCMEHSTPRIIENNIIFNIPLSHIHYFYNNNKILSNTLFSFDKNMYSYYIYLSELPYVLEFIFNTNTRNKLVNKLIMSITNEEIVIEDYLLINDMLEKTLLLELEDEDEILLDNEVDFALNNQINNISEQLEYVLINS